jgi:hypothetical protein
MEAIRSVKTRTDLAEVHLTNKKTTCRIFFQRWVRTFLD